MNPRWRGVRSGLYDVFGIRAGGEVEGELANATQQLGFRCQANKTRAPRVDRL